MTQFSALLTQLVARLNIDTTSLAWQAFVDRLTQQHDHLRALLFALYGQRSDFQTRFEDILATAAGAWLARHPHLQDLDAGRERNPRWFQSNKMLGGIAYVDLFAGNLDGIRAKIPYFKELGLTYLHLMPLFKAPEGNSDGGYAVSSYRAVNPSLGSIDQLRDLAAELHAQGISLCLDFIFNHTSDEHDWAKRALAGDPNYQAFYHFLSRPQADQYDRTLREIFPDQHPGAFTALAHWRRAGDERQETATHAPSSISRPPSSDWVWTTFNSFQLDLNYANPHVFNAMVEEMLYIANLGVDVLRMDAVAFIWKQLGTSCENLPEAHILIQAFNAVARIAAPSLLFKSEAIVHPNDVMKYIRPDECQLSYNPLLMALLWNTLATREVNLLSQAIAQRSKIHADCAWVNYVRCHDDIGWTFSDDDAAQLGINGFDHRQFLNRFYTGRFEGTFARGVPFQENPKTGDCRISGTTASLAGLEKAIAAQNEFEIDLAIRRIVLVYGVAMSYGGIPLIYLNDEIGELNDYSYCADPHKASDSRWVHRPVTHWQNYELRHTKGALQSRIFSQIKHLIDLRKNLPALSSGIEPIETQNAHVLGFAHYHATGPVLIFANFSERPQAVRAEVLHQQSLGWPAADLISDGRVALNEELNLSPYQLAWLKPV